MARWATAELLVGAAVQLWAVLLQHQRPQQLIPAAALRRHRSHRAGGLKIEIFFGTFFALSATSTFLDFSDVFDRFQTFLIVLRRLSNGFRTFADVFECLLDVFGCYFGDFDVFGCLNRLFEKDMLFDLSSHIHWM